MKLFLLYVSSILIITICNAQVKTGLAKVLGKDDKTPDSTGWERYGLFMLNINQGAQNNWESGGERFQVGMNMLLNKAVHHKKGKYTFDNYLDIELGVIETASIGKFRKTTDRFDLTFEFEHSIGNKNHWQYGVLANINTQLFGGYKYFIDSQSKLSSFLSPGKFLFSFGFDYKDYDSVHYFSFFISPATVRWVTKIDPDFFAIKKFGVDAGRKVYTEIGAYLSVHYNLAISKTLSYTSRLDLFSNYKRKPQNVDLLMNNLLIISISRLFAASVLVDLLYDHDLKGRMQMQEITGLGLRLLF